MPTNDSTVWPNEGAFQQALSALVRERPVDERFYVSIYGELPTGMTAAYHYITLGWKEGRDPNPWFSTREYLECHPDVAGAGDVPISHYIKSGWREKRKLSPSAHLDEYYSRILAED